MTRIVMALVGSIALCLGSAPGAMAEAAPEPPPEVEIVQENETSVEAILPPDADIGSRSTACRRVTAKVIGKSAGIAQFWLQLRVDWCYNGTDITYRTNQVTDYANGYMFWNTTTPTKAIAPLAHPYDVTTREKMKHCPPSPWSEWCNYRWPHVQIIARTNGGYAIYRGID